MGALAGAAAPCGGGLERRRGATGRSSGDRLARRQLHLRRGRALARQRLRAVRDALRDRPGRLRLRGLGLRVRPGADLRGIEANGCHRSDVAPIRSAPVAVDGEGQPRLLGGEGRERLAGVDGRAGGTSARRRRSISWRRSRGATTCGWSSLTVGANDVGFGELVAGCALDWARSSEDDPALCRGERRPTSKPRCRRWSGVWPKALRGDPGDDGRRRLPAPGLPAGDDGLRVAVPGRALDPLSRGRLEPAEPRVAARSGTPTPTGPRARAIGSIVAAMRRGRGRRRRRVPRPPPRPRRPPALRPPLAPGRPGGPVAGERRVGSPPRLRPGLQPRIPAPQRLRPARDRRLHRPPLREPARRLRLPGDARPQLRRRDAALDPLG